eukprot:COSAG01_NODE_1100_length_11694_cov_24.520138_5_plen_325_part_00
MRAPPETDQSECTEGTNDGRRYVTGSGTSAVGGGAAAAAAAAAATTTADDVSRALDAAGWTCFSTKLFLIAGLGWMADGAESAVLSYMLPTLMQQWSLTEGQLGTIGSLIAAGQAIGAIFWGTFADSRGRRPAFLLSVALTAVLGLLSAAAPGLVSYVALRFATGFAIGGNLPLAIAVASELLPPRRRDCALVRGRFHILCGRFDRDLPTCCVFLSRNNGVETCGGQVALHLFYELGAISSTGLALWLMPASCALGSPCAWRAYLLLVASPAMAVLPIAAWSLPESPAWLAERGGRDAEILAVPPEQKCPGGKFPGLTEGCRRV